MLVPRSSKNRPSVRVRFKDSRASTLDGDPYINHENGALEIHSAQPHNSGKYTCVARNDLGIYENHIYLEVKGEAHCENKTLFKANICFDTLNGK